MVGGWRSSVRLDYVSAPFPHLAAPQLLAPCVFDAIRFPDVPVVPKVRTGRMIAIGEPLWDAVMAEPGWAEMKRIFLSEEFVLDLVGRFAGDMRARHCLVDPERAYLDGFIENNANSIKSNLSDTHDPNALFVRFDFQAGRGDYRKRVHCDLARRLIGGVLFITGADEQGMQGGEFGLYIDRAPKNDRVCHAPQLAATYPCARNSGVLFLNGNDSFHGPTPISAITGERQWIYYSVSSRRDIWPTK